MSDVTELELVIFDLAGTTVEDRGEVPYAFTAALAEHGIVVTRKQISGVRGASKRQAILHFIPPGLQQERLAEEIYASFREKLTRRYACEGARAVSGATAVFG